MDTRACFRESIPQIAEAAGLLDDFGRMEFTLEEVGLADPRDREQVRSAWDGL